MPPETTHVYYYKKLRKERQIQYAGNIWRGKILMSTRFLNFWLVKYWQTHFAKLFGW